MANNLPGVFGPDADKTSTVPDGTGFSAEETAPAAAAQAAPVAAAEELEFDPLFPFGTPDQIDMKTLDKAGIALLAELNQRSWVKSVEYCSGHPLDRPIDEPSELYPYVSGENVYKEIHKLELAFVRGVVPDQYFRHRKQELRTQGMTRFYLNVNVYSLPVFIEWSRIMSSMLTVATQQAINPLVVRFNPLRDGLNFSIYWDYWTLEERNMIHDIALHALQHIPV
jgi:hypothetical protein